MARRRYQKPAPKRRGQQWTILVREDVVADGKRKRKIKRISLGPASLTRAEAQRLRDDYLSAVNQASVGIGGACLFSDFAKIYQRDVLPTLASTSRERTASVIKNYLNPQLGGLMLREITLEFLQGFFTRLQQGRLSAESVDKIRDVLSAVLRTAVEYGRLASNPAEKVRLKKRRLFRPKAFLRIDQFQALVNSISEPYATMVYVAVFTALRVSELGTSPNPRAVGRPIAVDQHVIARIEQLKSMEVVVRAGRARRRYKAVKSCGPDDLVFQSVAKAAPMRDNNILSRHIKPAARKLGLPWVNWQVLRRSCATWLQQAGVDVKDAQGLMRHSRASTTQDVYQQLVPESQVSAVQKLTAYVESGRLVQ